MRPHVEWLLYEFPLATIHEALWDPFDVVGFMNFSALIESSQRVRPTLRKALTGKVGPVPKLAVIHSLHVHYLHNLGKVLSGLDGNTLCGGANCLLLSTGCSPGLST